MQIETLDDNTYLLQKMVAESAVRNIPLENLWEHHAYIERRRVAYKFLLVHTSSASFVGYNTQEELQEAMDGLPMQFFHVEHGLPL